MAALIPSRDNEALAAGERALLLVALGTSNPGRMGIAVEEVEMQIMLEDMLLMLVDGLSQTTVAAAETLAQLSSPENPMAPAGRERVR